MLIFATLHPERLLTITQMAEAYSISRNHLVKVVHEMGQHGFIATRRGEGGGIRLGRSPWDLADVIRAMRRNPR